MHHSLLVFAILLLTAACSIGAQNLSPVKVQCKGATALIDLSNVVNVTSTANTPAPKLLSYDIHYKNSRFLLNDRWEKAFENVPGSETSFTVSLPPGSNITFKVYAQKENGEISEISKNSTNLTCTSSENPPHRNPENVRVFGETTGSVTVFWTPMPPEDHNGNDFHYTIELKPYSDSAIDKPVNSGKLTNWQKSNYTFTGLPVFQAYQAKVSANNRLGAANVAPISVFGWSGEGKPEKAPDNLRLSNNQTELIWDPVAKDTVRGLFHGYKVTIEEQKLREWMPNENGKIELKVNAPKHSVQLPPQLRADRNYTVRVAVFNSLHQSAPSEFLRIEASKKPITGPVGSLGVHKLSASTVYLFWSPPDDLPNGPVVQYRYGYEEVGGPNSHFVQRSVLPPATGELIRDLQPGKVFRFYVQPLSRGKIGGIMTNVTFIHN